MAKNKTQQVDLEFGFFEYLYQFYLENKGSVRKYYREATKLFLDYNDSEKNINAFLRVPQFEALEIYVFIKEYLKNPKVHEIFDAWYHKHEKFEKRSEAGVKAGEQIGLFGVMDDQSYKKVFSNMKKMAQFYPNYIYALTMGTGKTILMATCIFYEFILAWKFPKDRLYCHNALVFAPDKTVLQSLREIEAFDMRKVVPPEYYNFLNSHLRFHYLDEAGTTLNTLDRSQFNIIVSNTQKIILKKKHKEKQAQEKLFAEDKAKTIKISSVYKEVNDLYDFDVPEDDQELTTNQRFSKLCRLEQLGIYVDEAHHAFGNQLAKDMGIKKTATSLRVTIDFLAAELKKAGTKVVACYNYTGTPYVGREILPEVVYSYGLRKAIDNKYLKTVVLHSYTNPKETEFVRLAIEHFWQTYGEERREGILPKIAFFAATIKELTEDLRPKIEKILAGLNISTEKILINVGDEKITSNDDIREFNRLDSMHSDKQFILLVNKGREGWNCRSLFAVGMYRTPKSKVFVLQATMRCLREIGQIQDQANVYLSDDNYKILEDELQQNFRISAHDIQHAGKKRQIYQVRPTEPPVTIKMKRIRKEYDISPNQIAEHIYLESEKWNTDRYRLMHIQQEGMNFNDARSNKQKEEDLTHLRERREFSAITLIAEVARYLNKSPIKIESILRSTQDGIDRILSLVNEFNELIYDELIPRLFRQLYTLAERTEETEETIQLVKVPEQGYFNISADPELTIKSDYETIKKYRDKSFHLDTYCFDSTPEMALFDKAIKDENVSKIYFTGMLTHGQSDFYIPYIDPETYAVRSYYPDFLVREPDSTYTIIEVKGEHQIEDPVVEAKKESAEQLAQGNKMRYLIVPSKKAHSISSYLNPRASKIIYPFQFVIPNTDTVWKDCVPLTTLKAAAGYFSEDQVVYDSTDSWGDQWISWDDKPKFEEGMFVAKVEGKSMEPLIPDGSYCLFRKPAAGSRNGKIVLVWHSSIADPHTDGCYTVKIYQSEKTAHETSEWRHARIVLKPKNQEFEPIILEPEEEGEVRVIAEFVQVIR